MRRRNPVASSVQFNEDGSQIMTYLNGDQVYQEYLDEYGRFECVDGEPAYDKPIATPPGAIDQTIFFTVLPSGGTQIELAHDTPLISNPEAVDINYIYKQGPEHLETASLDGLSIVEEDDRETSTSPDSLGFTYEAAGETPDSAVQSDQSLDGSPVNYLNLTIARTASNAIDDGSVPARGTTAAQFATPSQPTTLSTIRSRGIYASQRPPTPPRGAPTITAPTSTDPFNGIPFTLTGPPVPVSSNGYTHPLFGHAPSAPPASPLTASTTDDHSDYAKPDEETPRGGPRR
ncbi:MAG: hypothetical protein P1U40_08295 [Coxiellaceae bacterium]|nr:hypothetical protein [Coxiellaceae bacterium]